jgi:polyhydroxybutyrate depolymerase
MTRSHTQNRTHRGAIALIALTSVALAGCDPITGEAVQKLPAESAGLYTLTLQHDGQAREAVVYVPQSAIGTDAPMLLNFHGYGGQDAWHMEAADMRSLADREGFVLIYPQGTMLSGGAHWNAAPSGGDNKSSADDLGFTEALIASVTSSHRIDDDRVYAVGYSNGGMFSYYLACERPDLVAAAGSVSGTMLDGSCRDGDPTSIISIHGTVDSVIPYDGDSSSPSATAVVDYWRDRNSTDSARSEAETIHGVAVESAYYTGGTDGTEVEHHKVIGGGHVWFDEASVGTNEKLWRFLSRFDQQGAI